MPNSKSTRAVRQAFAGLAGILLLAGTAALAQEGVLRTALNEGSAAVQSGKRVQAQIDTIADDTSEAMAEYRLVTQALDRALVYNDNLQNVVDDQERQKAGMSSQLENFLTVEQDIVPLMESMIESLDKFIELDMPFRITERTERIAGLRALMSDSNVTTAERYRQILEAYMIEIDFGRKIEAYQGDLVAGSDSRKVDFLQVGRVMLAYQTQDKSETGFWDKQKSPAGWTELSSDYTSHIQQALRVAKKQAAPELLKLPVQAPAEAAR